MGCAGSIILNEDLNLIFRSTLNNISFKVVTARLEGCGCFRLYQKNGSKGRSQLVKKRGVNKVNLKGVGSIDKEKCVIDTKLQQTNTLLQNTSNKMGTSYLTATNATTNSVRISSVKNTTAM